MALKYKEAFGLTDNPFGPKLPVAGVPIKWLQELEWRPLFVHRSAGLEKLYCDKIPSFKSACEDLSMLLDAANYSANPPSRGTASFFVAIEGDRGAGKTTLASRMIGFVQKCLPAGDPAWRIEEVLLKSTSQTANEQAKILKEREAAVLAAKAEYNCILIDDLRADAYPDVAQMYENLTNECVVFLVFTSFDPKMAEQIDKSLHTIHRFRIASLTPDDAIEYVSARYNIYRDAPSAAHAPPLFPFDEADIRHAVTQKVLNGAAEAGPVNLRLVASFLEEALRNKLQEIAKTMPAFDIKSLTAADFAKLEIKVAQSYKIIVRT